MPKELEQEIKDFLDFSCNRCLDDEDDFNAVQDGILNILKKYFHAK